MDRVDLAGTSLQGASKIISLDGLRRLALEHIEAFLLTCADQKAFSAASSEAEIERFVSMLQNPSSVLKGCAVFALLQFTVSGGRDGQHNVGLLQRAGGPKVLRRVAAATTTSMESKILARIVLHNLEYHGTDASG